MQGDFFEALNSRVYTHIALQAEVFVFGKYIDPVSLTCEMQPAWRECSNWMYMYCASGCGVRVNLMYDDIYIYILRSRPWCSCLDSVSTRSLHGARPVTVAVIRGPTVPCCVVYGLYIGRVCNKASIHWFIYWFIWFLSIFSQMGYLDKCAWQIFYRGFLVPTFSKFVSLILGTKKPLWNRCHRCQAHLSKYPFWLNLSKYPFWLNLSKYPFWLNLSKYPFWLNLTIQVKL